MDGATIALMDMAQPPKTLTFVNTSDEDQYLIHRFLNGEETAFAKLVNKYRQQVFAVAFRFTGNTEEADDLTQETFIKAYQNLNKFRHESSFKTWLLRITTYASINLTKSGRVAKDSGEAPSEHLSEENRSFDEGMIHDEQKNKLRKAIGRLPPKQKEALMLKTFGDMTCQEVADLMKCSVGTVKANVFNALKRLKSLMNAGV